VKSSLGPLKLTFARHYNRWPIKKYDLIFNWSIKKSGVNFINILQVAFACADPKIKKTTDYLTEFFALLESALVKAVHRMLMKKTPVLLNV